MVDFCAMIGPSLAKMGMPSGSGDFVKADRERPPNKKWPNRYCQVVSRIAAGQRVHVKRPPSLPRPKSRTVTALMVWPFSTMQLSQRYAMGYTALPAQALNRFAIGAGESRLELKA